MEVKNGSHIALANLFLIVSCTQECQRHTISTQGRFNHVRDVFLLLLIVKVGHILTGGVLMLGQIVIGTVCDTPQLAPSEREQKFQIGRRLAVEAQLFR